MTFDEALAQLDLPEEYKKLYRLNGLRKESTHQFRRKEDIVGGAFIWRHANTGFPANWSVSRVEAFWKEMAGYVRGKQNPLPALPIKAELTLEEA